MKKLSSLLAKLQVMVGMLGIVALMTQPSLCVELKSSLMQKKLDTSETNFSEAEVYNKLGIDLAEQGNFAEAIAAFNRAIDINPSYERAYHNLGVTLTRHRKFPEASTAFKRAIEINPNDYDTYNDLGIALGNQGKFSDAVNAFKRSIQINPNEPSSHQNLGMALWNQDKLPEAIASLQKARKLYLAENDTQAVQEIERILRQIKAP